MARGGKRPGAGRPKSRRRIDREADRERRQTEVWTKEAARERVRQLVCAELEPMVQAQIENAKGLRYLISRNRKTGKFVRVTEAMARTSVGKSEEIIEVWEKDPSVQAFTDLLNRAIDKPKEQAQVLRHGLDLESLVAESMTPKPVPQSDPQSN